MSVWPALKKLTILVTILTLCSHANAAEKQKTVTEQDNSKPTQSGNGEPPQTSRRPVDPDPTEDPPPDDPYQAHQVASTPPSSTSTYDVMGIGLLNPAEIMRDNRYLQSPNLKYTLIMQSDGSLVMYRRDGSIRYSMAKHGAYAQLLETGDFVEFGSNGNILWHTNTASGNPRVLWVRDNGDLQLTTQGPIFSVVWSIGSDPILDAPPNPPTAPMASQQLPGAAPTFKPPMTQLDTYITVPVGSKFP